MLSTTLDAGLRRYGIGEKLRTLRLRKKMGLVQLGEHTGLSPAMLSKIERGRLFPTLPTLLRIALVFSVGLEHFFVEPAARPTVAVVRKKDRKRFPDRPGATTPSYFFECLDYPATERTLNSFYVEFAPARAHGAPHRHDGVEVIYVIDGSLSLMIGEEDHTLAAGDSIYFDSTQLHAYRKAGGRRCSAVLVTTG